MTEEQHDHEVTTPYSETLRAVADSEPLTWPADDTTVTETGDELASLAEDQLKAHMVVGRMY